MNGQKFVEVKVGVPVQIIEFLKGFNIDVQEWLNDAVLSQFGADLDAFWNDPGVFMDLDELVEKLREVPHLAENYKYLLKDCLGDRNERENG